MTKPSILSQEFCIYCQRDFDTPKKLQDHVIKNHEGTYAYFAIMDSRLAERIDPGMALAKKADHGSD
jgi:hypothetical protein